MNYTRLDLLAAGVFQALALVFEFRRNSCSMQPLLRVQV